MKLKDLVNAVHQKKKEKSSMPPDYVPRPRLSDKKANGLTQCILSFFELHNIKSWRQNSTGRWQKEIKGTNVLGQTITIQKGKYLPSGKSGGMGAGDVTAVIAGRFFSIEVKIGRDRMRESQLEFKKEIEASGGVYLVVRTWDDFFVQIDKYIPKKS